MSIATRFSRLFKADVHGLLDRLEEPDVIVRQAVRDMEEGVMRRDAALGAMRLDLERQSQRLERLAKDLVDLDAQLALCLGSGKDDLARSVVRKRLETERLQQAVTVKRAATTTAIDTAVRDLDECREKLASIKQKFEVLTDRSIGAGADGDMLHLTVTDDDVEIALLRAKQQGGRA